MYKIFTNDFEHVQNKHRYVYLEYRYISYNINKMYNSCFL